MNDILQFLNSFFDAEVEAWHASTKIDIEDTRKKIDRMDLFCITELHESFGLVKSVVKKNDDFYERNKDAPKSNPRHLFKLSHYKHEKYGDLYLAYVSKSQPSELILDYFNCLFITKIDGDLKIIKNCFVNSDELDEFFFWSKGEGTKDLTFDTAGKFISCERYQEPEDCEFSMQDYLQDK